MSDLAQDLPPPEMSEEATAELFSLVYDELRALARSFLRHERTQHTLQATALVHEAYLRLASQRTERWPTRAAFFRAASLMLRRILVNYENRRRTQKRGRGERPVSLEESRLLSDARPVDVVALDELLTQLAEYDPRQCQVVELRIFGGLTLSEISELLGISRRVVDGDWAHARAWLHRRLRANDGDHPS